MKCGEHCSNHLLKHLVKNWASSPHPRSYGGITKERVRKAQMAIVPREDYVLILPTKREEKSKGGIYLPGNEDKRTGEGEVVAVGPGKRNADGDLIPVGLEVGNTVLFSHYQGNELERDGTKYLLIRAEDIHALDDGK